jgi:dihydroneopterin aldolase
MKTLYAVHVRGLVLSLSVGIYDSERAARQEVVISVCIFRAGTRSARTL